MKKENLKVVIDTETTGVDSKESRIVSIAIDICNDKNVLIKRWYQVINPTIPIPKEASEVHKITDEDVKGKPTFKDIANEIVKILKDNVIEIIAYNLKFDLSILVEEFDRAGIDSSFLNEIPKYCCYNVWNKAEPRETRKLADALAKYCNTTLEDAHNAQADTSATFEVYKVQMQQYPIEIITQANEPLNNCVDYTGRFVNDTGKVVFNFGKYKGLTIKEVYKSDTGYLSWCLEKANFTESTKAIIRKELI